MDIGHDRGLFITGDGPAIGRSFETDFEILLFQLKFRNRVLPHQVDDGFDIFKIHGLVVFETFD